jgi:hypothetical protein
LDANTASASNHPIYCRAGASPIAIDNAKAHDPMWKPFRNSTLKPEHAPRTAILFDKFHVLRHLGDALDQVRKSEYGRLVGKDRRFIKVCRSIRCYRIEKT